MRNDFKQGTFLCHGKAWANHKYVAKIKLPSGKDFYFYDTKTYQNYLSRQGKSQGQNAKANPNKDTVEKAAENDATLKALISKGTPGKTTAEKTATLKKAVSEGSKKIQEALSKQSKKSSGSSSKKKSNSIAGKSKGSSGSSSKSGKASGSSKGSSKAAKAAKEKSESSSSKSQSVKQQVQKQTQVRAFDSAAAMKLMYGITDDKVNKYTSKEKMLENMSKYDDNSYGYLTAKNTTYKWEKTDGQIKLIDMNTDKEISADEYLKDVSSIQEFRTDNIKRKSKYRK